MPWVRLDSSFPEHPKVTGLSASAFRLYVTALCYASRNSTDGHIPDSWLSSLSHGWGHRHAITLSSARLWVRHPDDNGWIIHDYLDWQESSADRNRRSKAAKRAAAARWNTD